MILLAQIPFTCLSSSAPETEDVLLKVKVFAPVTISSDVKVKSPLSVTLLFRITSCPRIGFTTDVFGNGLALGYSGIFQKTFNNNSFYSGIGLAFGKELSDPIVGNIILLNIGFSKRIKNLYLNIEFNPSLQKWLGNTRNETNYFGVANSSFSIGYVF